MVRKRVSLNLSRRTRYDTLCAEVARAIDEADPVGLLVLGSPEDEYSPEIDAIIPRISKASGPAEVRRIVHEEFVRWFDAGLAGPEETYDAVAGQIWEAVLRFRAG
jgi:hypothetical protein